MFLNSQSAGILLKSLSEWNFVEKHPPAPCPPTHPRDFKPNCKDLV